MRAWSAAASSGRTLVLAADCVWLTDLVEPFVATLARVCCGVRGASATTGVHGHSLHKDSNTAVLLAYKSRTQSVDSLLAMSLARHGYSVAKVPTLPSESRGSVVLWQLHRDGKG
jgi:hypothetical protein